VAIRIKVPGTPSTKVRAADSLLNHALKAIEKEDILVRLSVLHVSTPDRMLFIIGVYPLKRIRSRPAQSPA
jgi:hypothetical protein